MTREGRDALLAHGAVWSLDTQLIGPPEGTSSAPHAARTVRDFAGRVRRKVRIPDDVVPYATLDGAPLPRWLIGRTCPPAFPPHLMSKHAAHSSGCI